MAYFNWEDGQEVPGQYEEIGFVTINGTNYPVYIPKISSDTPITAANLNEMQNRIEANIIDEIDGVVVDHISETNDQAYSANYINHFGKHSLTEAAYTGKTWTDGKPIYRRVIEFQSTTSPYNYQHGIQNIDKITNIDGYVTRPDGISRPLHASNPSYPNHYHSLDSVSKTNVEIFAGDNVKSSLFWHIIIEYTTTN